MQWRLQAHDSARFTWEVAGGPVDITTSYVGDALSGLIRAASDLKLGASATFTYFLGEPGGYRTFLSGAEEEVFIQLVRFDDLQFEAERWKGGALVWSGRVGTGDFIESVLLMSQIVLQENGLDGYLKVLGKPFPSRELAILQAMVIREEGSTLTS